MTGGPRYVIDTNSLMDCRLRYYPPDVFPTLWEQLENMFDQGILISHEEVLREIKHRSDEFANWATDHATCFVEFDQEQESVLIQVLTQFERLVMSGKRQNSADPFLIALAAVTRATLITEETSGTEQKPKIPNVCVAFGITSMPVLEMFRREGLRF